MKKLTLFIAVALLCVSGAAYAEMIEGSVTAVDLEGKKVSVTKADGSSVDVWVADATTYAGEVTALAEVIEGDDVKVEAEKDAASGNLTAKSLEVPTPTEEWPAAEEAPAS